MMSDVATDDPVSMSSLQKPILFLGLEIAAAGSTFEQDISTNSMLVQVAAQSLSIEPLCLCSALCNTTCKHHSHEIKETV